MAKFPEVTFAPTVVDGQRGVATDIVSTRIKPDVADQIFSYQPNRNAVCLILTKAKKKRKVSQYQFYFLQKDRFPQRDRVNLAAGYDADDVSIVVDNGDRFQARDIVLNTRSMERFLLTSVSSNTLTVHTRGLGTTAQAMLDNDELEVIGSMYPEGADVGTAKSIQEEAIYNYTQTIRTPFSFTGRDLNTDMFGGKDLTTEERWQSSQHSQKIEKAFLWSARESIADATSAKQNTATGGVHYWIQNENEWDLNGIEFNERNLTEYLEEAMRYGDGGRGGSKTKYLYCGSRYITEIENWGKDRLRYIPSSDIYGLNAKAYHSFHGKIILVDHPLFEGENADKAFLLDMNHLRYVYHQGRDTTLLRNRQGNGVDGETHEWRSDVGLEITYAHAHGFWRGISL
jgi:hypothetical protein